MGPRHGRRLNNRRASRTISAAVFAADPPSAFSALNLRTVTFVILSVV
jgi:hypothetical protein